MIRHASLFVIALLGCTAASAATDSRIRSVAYDPEQIVRIGGKPGIQSTIEFSPDERIENVAVGDSAAWQITPNRRASLLFVKPVSARSRTNMTVVTDKHTYMFDLVAGDAATAPVYALKFSYPNEPKAVAPSTAQQVAAAARPVPATTPEKLHFDWKSNGAKGLMPARVFDDGTSVYLAWDKETPLPAILTQNEDRKEGPVNYQMRGEYIVVTPVPANLVLRYGKRSAALWPTHQVIPQSRPATVTAGSRLAATVPAPAAPTPAVSETKPAVPDPSVKFANVTSLYSDKVTDNGR